MIIFKVENSWEVNCEIGNCDYNSANWWILSSCHDDDHHCDDSDWHDDDDDEVIIYDQHDGFL